MITWRAAQRADVPAVIALLADDVLAQGAPPTDMTPHFAAFDRMIADGTTTLIVAEREGQVIATYQMAVIHGLSLRASCRAQLESVRVARDLRGQGIGALLFADAETRARKAGCSLIQLTTNRDRTHAHAFYERLGFTASHLGYKRMLT